MIKLIVTDMDGTLLNNNHEIDEEFWPLLKKLQDLGVIFGIASGRPYYNLVEKFKEHRDDFLFIAENGSVAMYKGEELFSTSIDSKYISKIKEACQNLEKVTPVYCTKECAYIEKGDFNRDPEIVESEIKKYYNCIELIEDIRDIDAHFIKIAICDILGAETNSFPSLQNIGNELQVALSGKIWTDISGVGTNKGVALKEALKKLQISPDEAMAFGDYLNDLDMLKVIKYSYAMKNSHPDLFKIANYKTKDDNDNFGVINTIREVVFNEKRI